MTRKTNSKPRTIVGPFNERPASSANGDCYASPRGPTIWDALNNMWVGQSSPPASPHLYVASTGSDSADGSLAHPLATVTGALLLLDLTKWTGQPIVTVVDAINEGVNPYLVLPTPLAGASNVLLQGTLSNVTPGGVAKAPTGGTTGTNTDCRRPGDICTGPCQNIARSLH